MAEAGDARAEQAERARARAARAVQSLVHGAGALGHLLLVACVVSWSVTRILDDGRLGLTSSGRPFNLTD